MLHSWGSLTGMGHGMGSGDPLGTEGTLRSPLSPQTAQQVPFLATPFRHVLAQRRPREGNLWVSGIGGAQGAGNCSNRAVPARVVPGAQTHPHRVLGCTQGQDFPAEQETRQSVLWQGGCLAPGQEHTAKQAPGGAVPGEDALLPPVCLLSVITHSRK